VADTGQSRNVHTQCKDVAQQHHIFPQQRQLTLQNVASFLQGKLSNLAAVFSKDAGFRKNFVELF